MKVDIITYIITIIMVICLAVACFVYYEAKVNTCSSNPLVYASQYYTEQTGYEFIGVGYFLSDGTVLLPKIYFNSKNITIEKANPPF